MAVNTALVGYGLGGSVFHAPLIQATPGLSLTTVVSSRPERVRQDLRAVQVVPTFDQLLQDPSVQLITIASPNDTHYDYARRALLAGKHVVVDKPFTVTAAQADELIDLARRQGVLLSVFHNRRWDGDFRTVRETLAAGTLGELASYESHFDRFRPEWRDRWKERDDVPGSGALYDLGAHLIDSALVLFDLPETVTADLATQRPGGQGLDYFHLVLRYGRLRVILRAGSLVLAPGPRHELHGTRGSLRIFGMDPQEEQLKAGLRPGRPGWGEGGHQTELTTLAEGTRPIQTAAGQYEAYYNGMAEAITHGKPVPVDPAGARDVIRVIEAALRSQSEGRTVTL